MKEAKVKAGICIAAAAIYMLACFILCREDIIVPAVFALLMGMIMAADCFTYGREYELARMEETVEEIMEDCDAWMSAAEGVKPVRCPACNCSVFSMAAGRFVCACCGRVLEEGADGGPVQ